MQTLKRGVIIQVALFTIFFFLGMIYVLNEVAFDVTWWMTLIILGAVVTGASIWFLLTNKEAFVIVDKKQVKVLYASLIIIFGSLVLSVIGVYFNEQIKMYLNIIGGAVMFVASALGIYVSLKIFFSKNAGNE